MHQNRDQDTVELTSDEVRIMTIETLMNHFDLSVDGHKFKTEDIWNITVAASAQRQVIESAANQLVDAPDPSAVRYYLRNDLVNLMTLIEMENSCNEILVEHLPPGSCGMLSILDRKAEACIINIIDITNIII